MLYVYFDLKRGSKPVSQQVQDFLSHANSWEHLSAVRRITLECRDLSKAKLISG
jgi:hypothetical protein